MKKNILISALVLGLSSLSLSAAAQNAPSWNYVDVNYQTSNLDQMNATAHGFHASAIASLNQQFFMSLQVADMDVSRYDMNAKDLSIGIGLKSSGMTVTEKPADVFVQLRRGEVDVDGPTISSNANDDYWAIETGFRLMASDHVEFATMLSHGRFDEPDNDAEESSTSIGAQVRYFVSNNVAVQARAKMSKSDDGFGIGVMYTF